MSKEFVVIMPIAGSVSTTVEAENKEEALAKFYEAINKSDDWLKDGSFDTELEFYETLVEGNICYTYNTKVDIDEV